MIFKFQLQTKYVTRDMLDKKKLRKKYIQSTQACLEVIKLKQKRAGLWKLSMSLTRVFMYIYLPVLGTSLLKYFFAD